MGIEEAQEITGSEHASQRTARVVDLGKHRLIRDIAALKTELLGVLDAPERIVIDPAAVERVDTAALQLLFAFERDRLAHGRDVQWRAGSPAFTQAVAMLGLTLGTDIVAAR